MIQDYCKCGPPCPGPTKDRKCAICKKGFPDCVPACFKRDFGHHKNCPNHRRKSETSR